MLTEKDQELRGVFVDGTAVGVDLGEGFDDGGEFNLLLAREVRDGDGGEEGAESLAGG